jgi:enamine deaminase RidA (YjgF/YER057c/UK114 family)
MRRTVTIGIVVFISVVAIQSSALGLEKKNYNYSEWTKGIFSEVITVVGPGKTIYLAGVGAEDEAAARGTIRHQGDFLAQCLYSYDKIKRLLARHGATMNDIVKQVTYVTDIRYIGDLAKCRNATFGTGPVPTNTLLNISALAFPEMMVEIDVTAVVP